MRPNLPAQRDTQRACVLVVTHRDRHVQINLSVKARGSYKMTLPYRTTITKKLKNLVLCRNKFHLSMRSFAEQNLWDRAKDDLPVECQRPGVNILHIQLHPGLEIDVVTALDRPQASQSRTHPQPPSLPSLIPFDLLWNSRSRTHKRHLAFHDIPQLRPLVNRKLAKQP